MTINLSGARCELGDIRQLPVGLALMVLTTLEEQQAPSEARYLLTKISQQQPQAITSAIIEMVTTIMVYKFEQLTRTEVEAMLGITLQQTRIYQEAKEEGEQQQAVKLITRLLTKRFGELPDEIRSSVSSLTLPVLENLSESLLDFTSLADLQVWLEAV